MTLDTYTFIYFSYYRFKRGLTVKYAKIHESLTLSYMERGSIASCDSTLMMLHGFSSSKDQFSDMIKYLPPHIHVVAVDMPGHGGSTRRDDQELDIPSFVRILKKVNLDWLLCIYNR